METLVSPITVPSSRTSKSGAALQLMDYSSEKCDSVITVDSSESVEMPINWKRGKSTKCTAPNTSISNIQKVANWIKSIEESTQYNEKDCENPIFNSEIDERLSSQDVKSKGFVVVTCDYMKRPQKYKAMNKINYEKPIKNLTKKKTSHVKHNSAYLPQKNSVGIKILNTTDKISFASSVGKASYASSLKFIDGKSDVSSDLCATPKSIDSQKKELCTYLKLMDPSDKKEILALQHRRSTRVRNLAALQEKKELEKKMIETILEDKITEQENDQSENNKEVPDLGSNKFVTVINFQQSNLDLKRHSKDPTLKSYKELNINGFDSPLTDDLAKPKESFYFPFPPKNLTSQTKHFDVIMKKLIPKLKISLEKNLKQKSQTDDKLQIKKLSKNKENIQCIGKNDEEQSVEKQKSSEPVSMQNSHVRLPKNKLKHKHKIKLLSLECKNQKLRDTKFDSIHKKLTSAKFKIKLKRVPNRNDFMKHKKNRRTTNLKVDKKFKYPPCNNEVNVSSIINSEDKNSNVLPEIQDVLEQKVEVQEQTLQVNTESKLEHNIETSQDEVGNNAKDLQNLMVDVHDFNNLSDEHKKFLLESRLFTTASPCKSIENESFQNAEEVPPLYGFTSSDVNEIKLMCEIFEQSILKHSQKPMKSMPDENQINETCRNTSDDTQKHSKHSSENTEDLHLDKIDLDCNSLNCSETLSLNNKTTQNRCLEIDPNGVAETNCDILPYDKNIETKSLQKSLHFVKKKTNNISDLSISQKWDLDESTKPKLKRLSHHIHLIRDNGDILKAFYVDFNLIVCQEFAVSFWMQTPLGNVLGSQDMWIPRGNTQRLVLNNKCIQKESKEMVFCSETSVAYIELWTKEHKSDIREGPVADIFITIYFWKQRQHGIDKKVLQLENINGFADDVQYCILKSLCKIVVSWHVASEENLSRTFIHAYHLAPDYQMISHISDIEPVDHYVSSLHNIEGCDNLIMGCGEKKITLWNVEYGYKIATIELSDVGTDFSTLWVKCDRGFLFAIQQYGDIELRLIAINGINHSWKKLASYFPTEGFERLKGVCVENGLMLAFYDKGILCWKAETGEPVEEITMETCLIAYGNYVIFLEDDRLLVRHSLSHLLSMSVDEL